MRVGGGVGPPRRACSWIDTSRSPTSTEKPPSSRAVPGASATRVSASSARRLAGPSATGSTPGSRRSTRSTTTEPVATSGAPASAPVMAKLDSRNAALPMLPCTSGPPRRSSSTNSSGSLALTVSPSAVGSSSYPSIGMWKFRRLASMRAGAGAGRPPVAEGWIDTSSLRVSSASPPCTRAPRPGGNASRVSARSTFTRSAMTLTGSACGSSRLIRSTASAPVARNGAPGSVPSMLKPLSRARRVRCSL